VDSAERPTKSSTVTGPTPAERRGVAADDVRRHNLGAVIERLHLGGPMSRSDLTRTTGLNRSTIADLLAELTALGFVEERRGSPGSGPGRPSPVVQVRPQRASVLAVELAVDSVAVATVGLGGHLFNLVRVTRPRGRFSPEETVQDVAKLAGPLLDSLPGDHVLAGVGVAIVGVTRRADGFVHLAPNLGWRDVPLAPMLGAELALEAPVSAANEADLGALAEHRRGRRPGVANLVYISGEVGIGAGVVVDGRPLLGSAGYAGEAGHTLINAAGTECRCGATGCWETEAGEAALLRRAGLGEGSGRLTELVDRAAAGDAATRAAIDEVGRWLGVGIGDLVNVFNPDLVVLGGMYERLFALLEPSVLRGARERMLPAPASMVAIERSALGPNASLVGAAELVMSRVVADPAAFGAGRRIVAGEAAR
jgi:predicted NBD/HSP70 family sugar kinase